MFAMAGLTSGAVLNIFGDYILIERCGLGVSGAGLATACSQTISFLILLYMFLGGKTESKLKWGHITHDWKEVVLICKTGMPSLMRQGLSSISTMLLNGQAGLYGDAAVAAMTIVNRIYFFVFAVGLGIGQGFQPVCAFNYGARRFDRVRRGFLFTCAAGEVVLGAAAVAGIVYSPHLVGFFRSDPEVIAIGTFALQAQLVALFFLPLSVCANMMFQSIGKNVIATFLSSLRSGLFFLPAIVILPRFLGLYGIQIAQTVADILAFAVSVPFSVWFMGKLQNESGKDGKAE